MSSTKSGASLPSHENPVVAKDDKGTKDKSLTKSQAGNDGKKDMQAVPKSSSLSQAQDTKATNNTSSATSSINTTISSNSSKPSPTGGATATTTAKTSKTTPSATPVIAKISDEKKSTPMPTATRTATGSTSKASNAPPTISKHTSDPKLDSSATHAKRERAESFVSKSTTAAATTPKQSQQPSHSKPHTQQQQQQPPQQHRYFVPSRQNQEEAVFKMVQNIFKLLETRGPLTMAQLEYNLPILIFGSSPSVSTNAQTNNATASKSSPAVSRDPSTGDSGMDASNVVKKQNADAKTANNRTSLCEEKLIPGNMVPDIVELLVTLGLIQQQKNDDNTDSSGAATTLSVSSPSHKSQKQGPMSAKNQPRFAVHFGKPKQFLVTPTNILSEIAKAQSEIQFSRQRQELLKEALNMTDQQAAVRVKHIVLQHPQVVDDPVYVTALRNLQVDGMLMAGTSGAATAGNSNASSSSARDGSGKSKSGVGGSGKKVGSNKRRQSSSTPAKRKRQRSRKDTPADSGSGKTIVSPSGNHDVGSSQTSGGSLPMDRSKQISSTRTASVSNTPIPTQAATAVPPTSANDLKNT